MKICYIITEIAPGGAERVIYNLCCEALKKNHQITLVALKKIDTSNQMYQEFSALDITIRSFEFDRYFLLKFGAFRKFFKREKFDVVHSHLFHGNIMSRFLSRKHDFKLINTIHIMEFRRFKKFRFWLDKITFNRCEIHTAVANATAIFQAENLSVDVNKIKVVRNGINIVPQLTQNEIEIFKKDHDLDQYNYIIGSVGRLDYQKGYDQLFSMLNEISALIPANQKWAITLIGEGVERDNLERLIQNTPANLDVKLLGFFRNANQLNIIFDLFVIPSRSEGFSLVLFEVMRNGVTSLINNISCVVETLDDYENSRVIDFYNEDKKETAKAIVEMTLQSHKIQYDKIIDIETMSKQYFDLY